MKFTTQKQVRFHHCDPAGIVFYPQFFYLLHEVQEDFLAHIGFPQHGLIASGVGVPIVDLKTQFIGMCRHGEELTITLELTRIGGASLGMHYEIHGALRAGETGTLRLQADGVVVYSKVPHGKALRIPDPLRESLQPYLQLNPKKIMIQKIQPPNWAEPKGYANGILARGAMLFVGGQIGWNAQQQFESDDFVKQTRQTLQNIAAVLQAGGAGPEHMVRMTWYIVDCVEYNARLREIGSVYREIMGKNFPAMTCFQVAALVEERAKIEIEVTAVVPDPA